MALPDNYLKQQNKNLAKKYFDIGVSRGKAITIIDMIETLQDNDEFISLKLKEHFNATTSKEEVVKMMYDRYEDAIPFVRSLGRLLYILKQYDGPQQYINYVSQTLNYVKTFLNEEEI